MTVAFMRMFIAHGMGVGRLMLHVVHGRTAAIIAEECQKPQPEHVEGGDERRDDAEQPEHPASMLA